MFEEAAQDLHTLGVAVVPFLDHSSREHWEVLLWNAMDDMPEFKVRGRGVQRVLGGFGALGNPSSFHHPTVRSFRRKVKRLMVSATPVRTKKKLMDEARVAFVLLQFQYMGMTEEERPHQEARLRTDAYDEWCGCIHEWCVPCPVEFLPEDDTEGLTNADASDSPACPV